MGRAQAGEAPWIGGTHLRPVREHLGEEWDAGGERRPEAWSREEGVAEEPRRHKAQSCRRLT